MKASNWTPAFAGETNIRKAWFFVVIPAEAGIQDDSKKMKSSLDNFGLISICARRAIHQRPLKNSTQLLYAENPLLFTTEKAAGIRIQPPKMSSR